MNPKPAKDSTGFSIKVLIRIPKEAIMKTIGTAGYPHVLGGGGIGKGSGEKDAPL